MALSTVRINELPNLTDGVDLSLEDQLAIWIASENKTKKVSLQNLNTFFELGGGGGGHAPVEYLGEMIYIVEAGQAGTDTAPIPSLAGKDFTLERSGIPLIPLKADDSNIAVAEYEVLDAGGFKLLQTGDVLELNERFKLTIYSLIGGGPTGGTGGTTGGFIQGKKVVSTNTALDAAVDMNKVIQVRGIDSPVTLTLPSIDDIAQNAFVIIDTSVNNSKPCTVTTSGGQYFYFNNASRTSIFLMPGEIVWLWRDADGFYILNDRFTDRYNDIAIPKPVYKAMLNQLVCKGQLVLRADYPRLWELVQTFGASLVSDATWLTESVTLSGRTIQRPYRGCFSTGDGSATFRIPDLLNMHIRGLKSELGSDPERYLNKSGIYQDPMTGAHTHQVRTTGSTGGADPGRSLKRQNQTADALQSGADGAGPYIEPNTGVETRGENIGYLWVINT